MEIVQVASRGNRKLSSGKKFGGKGQRDIALDLLREGGKILIS